MKVFISWSGEKSASQRFAEGLADWLENLLPSVKPFYSTEDIKKGQAWFETIARELDASDFGILSLTPANAASQWINFEAGAIAKKVGRGKVVPVVLGMQFSDLKPPLSMFNGVAPNHDDLLRLAQTINGELGSATIEERRLERAFEKWWPDLEKVITDAMRLLNKAPESQPLAEKRDATDMLRELLELTRAQAHLRLESPGIVIDASEVDRLAARREQQYFLYKLEGDTNLDKVNGILSTAFPDGSHASPRPDRAGFIKIYVPAEAGPAEKWKMLLDQGLNRRGKGGR